MNATTGLADMVAAASYAGRVPKFSEYLLAGPADQRAIMARWEEIKSQAALGAWHWPNCREPDESIYAKSCLARILEIPKNEYGSRGPDDNALGSDADKLPTEYGYSMGRNTVGDQIGD